MLRLKNEFNHTLEIDKSRFICYVSKCYNESEAKTFIASIRKEHPDASHHCYAFIANEHHELQRSNDDGEPSGTAGSPMLEALKMSKIHDVCAVVVRYYGGVKLGAGGLIRAYSKAVSTTLKFAPKVMVCKVQKYQLSFSYDYIDKLDYLLKTHAEITHKQYNEQVTYLYHTADKELYQQIKELTKGQYLPTFTEEKLIEISFTDL